MVRPFINVIVFAIDGVGAAGKKVCSGAHDLVSDPERRGAFGESFLER